MSRNKVETVLKVHNVSKSFFLPHHTAGSAKEAITQLFKKKDKGGRYHHALKDISFEVKKGDFFGVVGRNGAGKSTLLKIMAQIYQPTEGSVKVKGKLVPFIELGVGFNNNLTGRQNVYLNGAMLGFSKKEMDAMYSEIVEFAELEAFMDQKLKNYSSGMRVRLAFSVAIRAEADILLLDEVLAVGDADFKKKCYAYFDILKQQKKTIILVSHGMGAIREYCNKAILIENGVVTHSGKAEDVADEYDKLFNKPKDIKNEKINKEEVKKRWGTNEAVIKEVDVHVDPDNVRIVAKVISNDSKLEHLKIGFLIKDMKGKGLAGANSISADGGHSFSLDKNEEKTVTFRMPNIFGNKNYNVEATLVETSSNTIHDKWKEAATFSNTKSGVFYPIVCPASVTIE